MYQPDTVMIDEDHYELLAEHGNRIAVVATINLEVEVIAGINTFYEYENTYVVESCHPNSQMDRVDAYHHLLNYHGGATDVVRKHVKEQIDSQEHSDDATPFEWELITGSEDVRNDEDLQETLDTVVSPERLDPPFDIPDDKPVATISCSSEQHSIIKDSNSRYGYAAVNIERFRGQTYIIGLTEERARTIADGCFKLKQEYGNMDMYESAQQADRAETIVHDAVKETTANATE